MESAKNAQKKNKYFCHDCNKEILIKNKEIKNGFVLDYKDGDEVVKILKCKNCYNKNNKLKNFRKCEVYSRVVGYLRPVKQWNEGKQQEYKERKEYL